MELRKVATAACISYRVGRAKDVADMKLRLREKNAGRACKYSSARCAASSFALSSTRWKVAERESESITTRGKWRKKV
eukprot:3386510-Pleurochrysis_carterae.AAC.1